MDQKGDLSIQIKDNNFRGYCSEFVSHTTLKTTAHLSHPYYAKLSVTRNSSNIKILCIKTSQSLMQVFYKNNEFQEHAKVTIKDSRIEKHLITAFTFKTEIYNAANPPSLIIGYRSGLISLFDTINERLIRLYNYDEKTKAPHKNQSVSLLAMLPNPNDNEVLVMFADSTATRYHLNSKTQNEYFVEKLKKFDAKTNFNRATNRFKHETKTKNNLFYCNGINDPKPELSFFFACAQESQGQNPKAFYKFNHRTISDLSIKKHASFSKTLLQNKANEELTVLSFVSLDGYLVLFELNQMEPLLSYKGSFGGINTLSFSNNCELIALSGQDDCITVLDLNTLTTLKCEGHKSFISRCIFQSISMPKQKDCQNPSDTDQETQDGELSNRSISSAKESQAELDFIRIIGAGLDAILSFWEFPKSTFVNDKWMQANDQQLPISLKANWMPEPVIIKPVHIEKCQDAIGWVELCDNMLIQCYYDGAVSTNLIRDLASNKLKEKEFPEDDQNTNV